MEHILNYKIWEQSSETRFYVKNGKLSIIKNGKETLYTISIFPVAFGVESPVSVDLTLNKIETITTNQVIKPKDKEQKDLVLKPGDLYLVVEKGGKIYEASLSANRKKVLMDMIEKNPNQKEFISRKENSEQKSIKLTKV